jgi:hypothetical protein
VVRRYHLAFLGENVKHTEIHGDLGSGQICVASVVEAEEHMGTLAVAPRWSTGAAHARRYAARLRHVTAVVGALVQWG